MRHRLLTFATAGLVLPALVACSFSTDRRIVEGEAEQLTDASFYQIDEAVPPGEPGDIIRSEQIASAPDGTRAWRVLYHSRDVHGADIVVSGTVLAPAETNPQSEYAVVSWAHPTTGVAEHCAPSQRRRLISLNL